ncbi:MAG TPA: hypothetical protein VK461_16680 [Acidimicrobiales bacterium]|nr:hypothetical protein [Acidimicrobiales bacterium]
MTAPAAVRVGDVTPTPTEEEMAAIVAAITMAWPRPAPLPEDATEHTPAWRFSGRWWARPVAVRRARPW